MRQIFLSHKFLRPSTCIFICCSFLLFFRRCTENRRKRIKEEKNSSLYLHKEPYQATSYIAAKNSFIKLCSLQFAFSFFLTRSPLPWRSGSLILFHVVTNFFRVLVWCTKSFCKTRKKALVIFTPNDKVFPEDLQVGAHYMVFGLEGLEVVRSLIKFRQLFHSLHQ